MRIIFPLPSQCSHLHRLVPPSKCFIILNSIFSELSNKSFAIELNGYQDRAGLRRILALYDTRTRTARDRTYPQRGFEITHLHCRFYSTSRFSRRFRTAASNRRSGSFSSKISCLPYLGMLGCTYRQRRLDQKNGAQQRLNQQAREIFLRRQLFDRHQYSSS